MRECGWNCSSGEWCGPCDSCLYWTTSIFAQIFSTVRKCFSGKPCDPLTSWFCLFSLYVHLIFLLQPIWGAGPTDADDLHHTVYSTGTHCRKWGPLGWEPAAPGTSPQTRGGPVDVNQGKKLQVLVLNQGEDL